MERLPHTYIANLVFLLLSILLLTINTSTSARPLNQSPPPLNDESELMLTFFMNEVVPSKHRSSTAPATGPGAPLLAPKPMGLFPIQSNPTFSTSQTSTPQNSWLPMLTNLQALEAGTVTRIDEEFKGVQELGLPLIGKVQGIYVTSSQDRSSSSSSSSHMVAMKATFNHGKSEDSLRFFGDLAESHVAVVGGTGRYDGANGFATIKAIDGDESWNKVLRVTVYLK